MKRKHLYSEAEIKAVEDDGKSYITGYASVYGNVDSYGDVVEPGAFTKTCSEQVPKGQVKFFYNHTEIKGVVVEWRDDPTRGLWIKAYVSKALSVQDWYTMVKEGILNRMSFAYDTIKSRFDTNTGIRHLTELKLYEVSVVDFPANEEAEVLAAKAAREDSRIDDLESKVKLLEETIKSLTAEPVKPLTEGDSQDTEPETPAEPVSPLTGVKIKQRQAEILSRLQGQQSFNS